MIVEPTFIVIICLLSVLTQPLTSLGDRDLAGLTCVWKPSVQPTDICSTISLVCFLSLNPALSPHPLPPLVILEIIAEVLGRFQVKILNEGWGPFPRYMHHHPPPQPALLPTGYVQRHHQAGGNGAVPLPQALWTEVLRLQPFGWYGLLRARLSLEGWASLALGSREGFDKRLGCVLHPSWAPLHPPVQSSL